VGNHGRRGCDLYHFANVVALFPGAVLMLAGVHLQPAGRRPARRDGPEGAHGEPARSEDSVARVPHALGHRAARSSTSTSGQQGRDRRHRRRIGSGKSVLSLRRPAASSTPRHASLRVDRFRGLGHAGASERACRRFAAARSR
jgi:hypothetical protein